MSVILDDTYPLIDSAVSSTARFADEGTIAEEFGRINSGSVTRQVVIKWEDRPILYFAFMGGAASIGGIITVARPAFHPQWPWLSAVNITMRACPGSTGIVTDALGVGATKYARCQLYYGIVDYGDGVELGEESLDISSTAVTAPMGYFHFNQGTNQVPLLGFEAPPMYIKRATLTRVLKSVPQIPFPLVVSLLNCVNRNAFLGADPEALLYLGCNTSRRWTSQGVKMWDLAHRLQWTQSPGWNAFPVSMTGQFERILQRDGTPYYPLADLSQLGFNQ